MTGTFTLDDGTKLRTTSSRRYVIFAKFAGRYSASARSDNLDTIEKRFFGEFAGYERVLVDTINRTVLAEV